MFLKDPARKLSELEGSGAVALRSGLNCEEPSCDGKGSSTARLRGSWRLREALLPHPIQHSPGKTLASPWLTGFSCLRSHVPTTGLAKSGRLIDVRRN